MTQQNPPSDLNPTEPPRGYNTAQFAQVVSAVRDLKHPTQIGPYHIVSLIGEGGMGTVYKAEQREPIHRIVALKIIKLGMDTREVMARFDSERQALAVMNHVNVAKVLDAGATDTGRPFFVMEFVQGEPITTFADRKMLTTQERLELFTQACAAVQHAHQKAIIHRDLKPSNILVTLQDDKPLVKVIDFGVAKAISHQLTDKTFFTETGQLVGTPEYMSPEQAEASALDVDTRTDVYSLGVVLYELLAGALPFDPKSLRSAGYHEIQRIIREVDPPKPSTRLSSLTDTLPSIAACRQIEPGKLGSLLRGELDWIVMKALEKDRTRRYESPGALSGDVMHYLADEPVAAGPPGGVYRARKFIRRHKWGFTTAALLALALAGGLIGTTGGFIRASQQRDEAIAARNAEAEAREYEAQTDDFLKAMFTSINPAQARGRDVLVREILDLATHRIDNEPPKHPLVEASLRDIFGRAYRALGIPDKAQRHIQRSVELYRAQGEQRKRLLMRALPELGLAELSLGKPVESEPLLREALLLHRQFLGPDHADTISVESDLAAVLIEQDRNDEAETLLTEALERVRQGGASIDPEARATVVNTLARLRTDQGRYAEAEALFRQALDEMKTASGDDHPGAIALASNLANVLQDQGKMQEAVALHRRALELTQKVNGPDHPDTTVAANNLALALDVTGQFDEAERVYRDAIERRRRVLGEDEPMVLITRANLALLLQKTGRLDEAEASFREVAAHMKRALGADNQQTLVAEGSLAMLRAQRGDLAEAEIIFRDALARAERALGKGHPVTISFSGKFGFVLSQQGKWAQAEPYLAASYAAASKLGVTSVQPGYAAAYGVCLAQLDKPKEALPILLQADQVVRAQPYPDPATIGRIAKALARVHDQLGQPDEANRWRQRVTSQPATRPG